MSFIMEQAGGKATTGTARILDIVPVRSRATPACTTPRAALCSASLWVWVCVSVFR
jgi:hypothetical protein